MMGFQITESAKPGRWAIVPAMVSMVLLCATVSATNAAQFEIPANRKAAEILPAELLKGPNYQVRETVVSYGYMHHWTVDSDFGTFEVTGDGALRALIREIYAIAALKEISQGEAFLNSVAYAAKQPFQFAGKMVTDPVDTVSALPKGVFQILENVGTSISMEHDPSEDAMLEQALFVSSWKRDFAAEYGVNVYSSNKVLQEQLNKVGWASAIGGLGVSAAMTPLTGGAGMFFKATRLSNQLTEVLKEEPPSRLHIINHDKLSAMGISKDLASKFLDHPSFTPRHDTIIVAALADLKNPRGRDVFLNAILSAQDEASATFYMNIAQTLQGYNETVSRIQEITVVNGLVVARALNGRALVPFPLDHGVWGQRGSRIINHMKQTTEANGFQGTYDLWITGTVSTRARRELTALGIEATENVDARIGFLD